jgi:hypothetical protein
MFVRTKESLASLGELQSIEILEPDMANRSWVHDALLATRMYMRHHGELPTLSQTARFASTVVTIDAEGDVLMAYIERDNRLVAAATLKKK